MSDEPLKILTSKLREIKAQGPIPVTGTGSGRYGLAIEAALGLTPNNDRAPDFMGIELKTKHDNSLQTLFSRTPSRYTHSDGKNGFFACNCYFDVKRKRNALYTSISCKPDSLGFSLHVKDQKVQVKREGAVVLEYDLDRLAKALSLKHSKTVFLGISRKTQDGNDECTLNTAKYCKAPSIDRFLQLISSGNMNLDFTMAEKPNGQVNDHGFLWRIQNNSLDQLYLSSEDMDIDE